MNRTAKSTLNKTISYLSGAYAPSTIRAFKSNFERFISFCDYQSIPALPANPKMVANYIQKLTNSNLKSASIRLAVASISTIHKLNQHPDPTQLPVAKIELRRMHRALGRASKQALGITAPTIEKMILATKNDLSGLRDKALILLAYDSLCRRSELVSIKLDDIEYNEARIHNCIRLRKSKTYQEAVGKIIKLTPRTQEATNAWIECSKINDGFLFRGIKNNGDVSKRISPGQVNRIYKRLAAATKMAPE